jgi:hypothetical protein
MNLATFVDSSPYPAPRGLGQAAAADDRAAWDAYLKSIRDTTVRAWNRARQSYLDLKRIRTDLGLPVSYSITEANPPAGAVRADFESDLINLGSMITVATKFADGAIAGTRRLVYVSDAEGLGIEALPSDAVVIGQVSGRYALLDRSGNPVAITATSVEGIGALGIAPILWVAGAAVAIAVTVAAYFAFQAACDAATSVTRQLALTTIERHSKELIESGKSTPEQEQKRVQATYGAATQLTQAEAAAQAAKGAPASSLEKTITTFLWVGLGVAALYAIAQFLARRPAPALARAR